MTETQETTPQPLRESRSDKIKAFAVNTYHNPEVKAAAGLAGLSIGLGVLLGVASAFSDDEDTDRAKAE